MRQLTALSRSLKTLDVRSGEKEMSDARKGILHVSDLLDAQRRATFDDFLLEWPDAVLLHRDLAEAERTANYRTMPSKVPSRPPPMALAVDVELTVTFLRKRPGGIFAERIGVGRTNAAALHIPYPNISRFHAYFSWSDDGLYSLTDAGSTNGTFVDGERVKAWQGVALSSGCVVTFGTHNFRFFTPAGFYEKLGEVSGRARRTVRPHAGFEFRFVSEFPNR